MDKKICLFLLIIQIISSSLNSDEGAILQITRSKSYQEQTGSLTPLVVTLSTRDISEKVSAVDLICVVDVSGSMGGDKIKLVKESLKYLVSIMNRQDRLAIIIFSDSANILFNFTQMIETNKQSIINNIDNLSEGGGTKIMYGLKLALELITDEYSTKEKVASIILLSDGDDSSFDKNKFIGLVNAKSNYAFTLHTLGYGDKHDAELMHDLSLIRDGGYFFVRHLSMVKNAILKIYGSLSTNYDTNVGIEINSTFIIKGVLGKEDMYENNLISENPSYFTTKLIHFIYGKRYNFITLVDIPEDTEKGTIILTAKVSTYSKTVYYTWDSSLNSNAYEEYIRGISFNYFQYAYNNCSSSQSKAKSIINTAYDWIDTNYDGIRDWKSEYNDIINDLNDFSSYGKANLLSKLRELKSSQLGLHYRDNENSYQRITIDEAYDINTDDWNDKEINKTTNITLDSNKNYIYFYLKEGRGKINGIHFSGKGSSIIFYSNDDLEINIEPLPDIIMKYKYKDEQISRLLTKVDLNSGSKFLYKKDLPFEFYIQTDGTRDITFNIQFLKLEYINKTSETPSAHEFQIKAYILDSNAIQKLKNNKNNQPSSKCSPFEGYYDNGHRVGKIIIKKEEIQKCLSTTSDNNLFLIISKKTNNKNDYSLVEGQLSFVSMNYVFAFIPESFYIFSNLSQGQKNPHLYTIKMEPEPGLKTRIEFASSGNELDCKVLRYNNYLNSDEYYKDYDEFEINRNLGLGKLYIDITQSNDETKTFDAIIISIFSTNGEHIAGDDINKLSYVFRYTTFSDYGIYEYNDFFITWGNINITNDIIDENNKRNISISYHPLAYEEDEGYFVEEKTRFYMWLFPLNKRADKIYETISLFETKNPLLFLENEKYDNHFDFQIDPNKNYFLTTYTVSKVTNEILCYKNLEIRRKTIDLNISDDNSYGNEYEEEINIDIMVAKNITKHYFQVKISEFNIGEYGILYVIIEGNEYKSIEPSNNIIIIPSNLVREKKVNIQVELKDHRKIGYYLEIKMIEMAELTVGENFFFVMEEYFNETMEITINNIKQGENKMNIFIKSSTGNFDIHENNLNIKNSDIFGAKSINTDENSVYLLLRAQTGEYFSIYTHIIDDSVKRAISNTGINIFGYLEEKECIYLEEMSGNIKYQIRLLSDKEISIKYDSATIFDYTKQGELYLKEFNENLQVICLTQKNILDGIFFNIQIISVDDIATTKTIVEKLILGYIYKDILIENEIRYYRQGLFIPNPSIELMYLYNVRQIKGEIQVYISQCNNFPYCEFSKEDLENNKNVIRLYNIDEYFTYSKRAKDLIKYDPQKFYAYIILCKTKSCEFNFIINTSISIINLSKLEKYSTKIYKNNIDKFLIKKIDIEIEILVISLYTHSGEVVISTNDKCENIKRVIFGNVERMEIPKICGLDYEFEIYVEAKIDSIYSIEYNELKDSNISKIKSNIVHIEKIITNKTLEFTPIKKDFLIKFIPINCQIEIKYKIKGEYKSVSNYQNIFIYDSLEEEKEYEEEEYEEEEKSYIFEIFTKSKEECMVYTYLEEFKDNFYSIISDQIPYYLSLKKTISTYKLIFPIPNSQYLPHFKINFFEETPITIYQSILNEKDEKIEALFSKDIKTNPNILKNCDEDNICYLTIELKKEIELEKDILIEILPKSSNNIPSILFDNILKQDFVKINQEQIYMAKILKNEVGEVCFNYKYYAGELIGKLVNIEKIAWKNKYELPRIKEYLTYDNLRQKIIFTQKETEKCNNGCYLFVEVHPYEKYLGENDNDDLNMDYSIYLKKSEKIVQLRYNEIIMGTLSKTIEENYIEYYSIEIIYSTTKIYIDYSSDNTNIIINSGDIKPTKKEHEINFVSTGKDKIFVIEKNSQDLKGMKYIIGIYTNKLKNGVSQYSFRIRIENKLIPNYIISDMSTENIYEANNKNEICYFLMPIINTQKNSNLFLYAISTSNSDDLVISYKKIEMNVNIIKNGKYIDDNIYTKVSKAQFIKNMLYISNTEMNLNENDNILIKIETPESGMVTLLHTFKTNLLESLLNPKNKQLFYVNPNSELYLNIPQGVKGLVHINVISGKARLGYENDEENIQEISGKYSSMYFQITENNLNRIKIMTLKESDFSFYAYIKIGAVKRNINEMKLI